MPYHSHKGGSRSGNHVSLSLVSNRRVTVFHDHRPLFFPWTFVNFIAVICQVPSPLCIMPGPETAERTRHWFEVHCGALKTAGNGACVSGTADRDRRQQGTRCARSLADLMVRAQQGSPVFQETHYPFRGDFHRLKVDKRAGRSYCHTARLAR